MSALLRDELFETTGGKVAAQAYWNALTKLRIAWKDVYDDELPTVGNNAKDAFGQAVEQMRLRLATDAAKGRRLREELDVAKDEDIVEVLLRHADMDDLSPKLVRTAIREQCIELGEGRHELRALLRPVLDRLFAKAETRRPRVGPNRHWPRLLQYLRELEWETTWSTGQGIRLANLSGRGRVAQDPKDPLKLSVRIDPDYL